MMSGLEHPNVRAALERAGLHPPSPVVAERVTLALGHADIEPDEILEFSEVDHGTEQQTLQDCLLVQTRQGMFMVTTVKRGLFRPDVPVRVRCLYSWYRDLIEDDELAGPSVFFVANPGHHDFLLSFKSTAERNRMFPGLFEAHRGRFVRWGMRLDPANFAEDFARFSAELRAGPGTVDEYKSWFADTYGDVDYLSALGLADACRSAQLWDERSPTGQQQARLFAGGAATWIGSKLPEARRTIVQVGEELYDAGLFGPPYDERTFLDDEISHHDAGPLRLVGLITLASFARQVRDPRAEEWTEAAERGLARVEQITFPDSIRELWSDVGTLP